ncbi:Phytochrome-like protein cph1 [Neolewinella maritima]|uniref:histidine kinase n=1 Tax=Neolewinella maritima TaxID=1383882 RepID=A0ABM9AWB4_9BACT|nr:ATP-binding protein [Neolewinella maritima]CAH0998999.1 Phytochrome-like protein cph1 [Neolewinella maritima]
MSLSSDPVAQSIREVYPYPVDLENCDVEPLRHIQVVQAHACLLAVEIDSLIVRYVSENTLSFLGKPWEEIIDAHVDTVLSAEVIGQIPLGLGRTGGFDTINPILSMVKISGKQLMRNVIIHRTDDLLLIEVEARDSNLQTAQYQQLLARSISRIQNITDPNILFPDTALIIKQISGYDRVMVYQFDKDYNGEVIAEARNETLESFEGLRYPHTDIPKQARELYLTNRIRLISSAGEVPARIQQSTQLPQAAPLDLTLAGSRGVSPVHLEYLGYMGVNNSLSVAIVLRGKLWGLFALHHYSPRHIDYEVRNVLMFIGEIFSGHLSLQAANRYREQTLTRKLARLAIGEQITKTRDIFAGLTTGNYSLLNMFPGTSGTAVYFEGRMERQGDAPDEADILALAGWIREHAAFQDLYYESDSVSKVFPPFAAYCDSAAGVMMIFLDATHNDWICWFRPGMVQQISWGGKPNKQLVVTDTSRRLGPRQSFARYVQTVEGCSAPWTDGEIDTALALRITVINSLMQRYTEVKEINERLQKAYEDLESFSYTVSHDLRAPLRAINGYAEILEEEYGEELNDDAKTLLGGIQRGVEQMNSFITDILELSRVGSGGLQLKTTAVIPLIQDVLLELNLVYLRSRKIAIHVDEQIPPVVADPRLLRQLYTNLLSNSLKYVLPDAQGELAIRAGAYFDEELQCTVYTVSNTGPEIPVEYRRSIFQMFSRMSSNHESEGTGVGLAIVERIVERHMGKVWVDDTGLGVTFHFYLKSEHITQ